MVAMVKRESCRFSILPKTSIETVFFLKPGVLPHDGKLDKIHNLKHFHIGFTSQTRKLCPLNVCGASPCCKEKQAAAM